MASDKWNRSSVERAAQDVLGIHARVWVRKDGRKEIGLQRGELKHVLGGGSTWLEAIQNTFVEPVRIAERLREVKAQQAAEASQLTAARVGEADGLAVPGNLDALVPQPVVTDDRPVQGE